MNQKLLHTPMDEESEGSDNYDGFSTAVMEEDATSSLVDKEDAGIESLVDDWLEDDSEIQQPKEDIDNVDALLDLTAKSGTVSSKPIRDSTGTYLTEMGQTKLATRDQEIALAKNIEITRSYFRASL